MFIRFRLRRLVPARPGYVQRRGRLEISLVGNRRAGDRVTSQHVAFLGSIAQEGRYGWKLTAGDRKVDADWFWRNAIPRLETHVPDPPIRRKLIGDIVKRIGRRPKPKQ
jgi:hypothetical protein